MPPSCCSGVENVGGGVLSLKDRIKDSLTSKYWYFCCQRKPQFLRIEQKLNTIEQVLNIYRE